LQEQARQPRHGPTARKERNTVRHSNTVQLVSEKRKALYFYDYYDNMQEPRSDLTPVKRVIARRLEL
jgi:hypothetical protein